MSVRPASIGFYGKIPSRGDFVRSGLSHALADAVHAWMQAAVPRLEVRLGPDWRHTWARARPWRFAARAGVFARETASGVWLPSSDRVGRPYPLLIAAEHALLDEAALAAAEACGTAAVRDGAEPGALIRALAAVPAAVRAEERAAGAPIVWWRAGGETVAGDALAVGPGFLELLAP